MNAPQTPVEQLAMLKGQYAVLAARIAELNRAAARAHESLDHDRTEPARAAAIAAAGQAMRDQLLNRGGSVEVEDARQRALAAVQAQGSMAVDREIAAAALAEVEREVPPLATEMRTLVEEIRTTTYHVMKGEAITVYARYKAAVGDALDALAEILAIRDLTEPNQDPVKRPRLAPSYGVHAYIDAPRFPMLGNPADFALGIDKEQSRAAAERVHARLTAADVI
jgi:hypothetical protein